MVAFFEIYIEFRLDNSSRNYGQYNICINGGVYSLKKEFSGEKHTVSDSSFVLVVLWNGNRNSKLYNNDQIRVDKHIVVADFAGFAVFNGTVPYETVYGSNGTRHIA